MERRSEGGVGEVAAHGARFAAPHLLILVAPGWADSGACDDCGQEVGLCVAGVYRSGVDVSLSVAGLVDAHMAPPVKAPSVSRRGPVALHRRRCNGSGRGVNTEPASLYQNTSEDVSTHRRGDSLTAKEAELPCTIEEVMRKATEDCT